MWDEERRAGWSKKGQQLSEAILHMIYIYIYIYGSGARHAVAASMKPVTTSLRPVRSVISFTSNFPMILNIFIIFERKNPSDNAKL